MRTTEDIDAAIARVLEAETSDFVTLVKIAGLNPATDLRFANLSNIDFSGANLAGFDFRGAMLSDTRFCGARICNAKFKMSRSLARRLREAMDSDEYPPLRRMFNNRTQTDDAEKGKPVSGKEQQDNGDEIADQGPRPRRSEWRNLRTLELSGVKHEEAPQQVSHSWFEANADAPSPKVLADMLQTPLLHPGFEQRTCAWLDANPTALEAASLLLMLLRYRGPDPDLRQRVFRWLDAFGERPTADELLIAVLEHTDWKEEILPRVFYWLDRNMPLGRAVNVLLALLQTAGSEEQVLERAVAWVDAEPGRPAGAPIVAKLMRMAPEDQRNRECALRWIDGAQNASAAAEPLALLLVLWHADEAITERALRWVKANEKGPVAGPVVAKLLSLCDTNDLVREQALRWLAINRGIREIPRFLVAFAERTRRAGALNSADSDDFASPGTAH